MGLSVWRMIGDSTQREPDDLQERTVRGVPDDAEECGNIPAPQEQAHLRCCVRSAPKENRRVKNKPQRAGEQKARNHTVAKEPVDQCGFARKKNGDKQLCRDSS